MSFPREKQREYSPRISPTDNYAYDRIGTLTSDQSEGLGKIDWTVYGKIRTILKSGNTTIGYGYDAGGNRISKTITTGGTPVSTYYVRDAQGNTLGVYSKKNGSFNWDEQHLYGSSRLGMLTPALRFAAPVTSDVYNSGNDTVQNLGKKLFELSNHLGNVLATVTDKRIPHSTDGTNVDYTEADVVSANEYYPFGMMMPGRSYAAGSYRYGFNGKENDNEVKGEGNQIAFEARIYDPRLGRFLSPDPLEEKYPYQSTYVFAHNNPIALIDYLGMGDPPEMMLDNRHLISGADFKGKEVNSVVVKPEWQNQSTLKSFYNEAVNLVKQMGKTEKNVTLSNGTTWNVNVKTGHFYPVSGDGIVNLTQQEMSILRGATGNGSKGEAIFANIAKNKSISGTFSESMQTALNSLAKIEGVTDATALKHIGGHLPSSAATTEMATAANKSFGSGAWKYAKWGGRALIVVGVASDLYEIYNSDNKARTITTKVGGWAGASAGASGGAAIGAWAAGWGAIPGAIIGGIGGYFAGEKVTEVVYDWIFTKEK